MNYLMFMTVFLTLLFSGTKAIAGSHAIFLFDDSSSMMEPLPSGTNRCKQSKAIAKVTIRNFFEKWEGQTIDIKSFSDGLSFRSLTNGFTANKAEALAAIDDTDCNGGSTSLAEAICKGIVDLQTQYYASATNAADLLLAVATDGEENSSIGECGGSNWRQLVEQKLMASAPPIRMNMNVFGRLDEIAEHTASSNAMASESLQYFSKLSKRSGGQAMFLDDESSEAPRFFPMFPTTDAFFDKMGKQAINLNPWNDMDHAKALGFEELAISQKSLERVQARIDINARKAVDFDKLQNINKIKLIERTPEPYPRKIFETQLEIEHEKLWKNLLETENDQPAFLRRTVELQNKGEHHPPKLKSPSIPSSAAAKP